MKKIALIGNPDSYSPDLLRERLTAFILEQPDICTLMLTSQLHNRLRDILDPLFPARVMVLHPSFRISHQFATAVAHQQLIDEADHVLLLSDSPDLYGGRILERCMRAGKPLTKL